MVVNISSYTMAQTSDVMDDMLVETLLSEPDPAQPSTSGASIEFDHPRSKRPRISGKTGKSGAASKVKPVNAVSDEAGNGGKNTLEGLLQKVSQLTEIINTFAPVVQELKGAYDAGLN